MSVWGEELARPWIESTGGPLIVVPRACSAEWKGITNSDYDEACGVTGYLNVLNRHWGQVLVLGDEPMSTCVIQRPEGLAVVRWMYGPSEGELLNVALTADLDGLIPVESLRVTLRAEPYVILDSSDVGSRAESIEFTLHEGVDVIRTYRVKDEAREVWLILHSLGR